MRRSRVEHPLFYFVGTGRWLRVPEHANVTSVHEEQPGSLNTLPVHYYKRVFRDKSTKPARQLVVYVKEGAKPTTKDVLRELVAQQEKIRDLANA